jgi:nanoRNase/pAp phosphatase (c-di-AMP/oligoRNAs hydrolase)
MLQILNLRIHPLDELHLPDFDFFLFVDSQPGSGNNSCRLPADARYGVVDHHIMGEAWPHEPVFLDLRESYGATATLAYEYLLARNLKVDVPLATALYYAIRTETSDMGRGASKPDRAVYLKLHPKIDWDLLHLIVNSRLPVDYFIMMKEAVERAERFGKAMVVDLGPTRHPDFVAEVADTFRRLEGIHWVLVWGWREDRVVFSIRNNLQEPHVGRLARELVREHGSAGGHRHMAGGQVSAARIGLEEARLLFRRSIVPAFLRAVGQPEQDGVSLVQEASSS